MYYTIIWLSSRCKSYEPPVHFWLSFRLQRETTRRTTRSTIPRNQDPASPFRFRVRKVGRPRCAVKPLAQSRQPLPPMILSMKVCKFWIFFLLNLFITRCVEFMIESGLVLEVSNSDRIRLTYVGLFIKMADLPNWFNGFQFWVLFFFFA